MWKVDISATENAQTFIVRPNASLSPKDGLWLFAGIVFFSTLIVLRFLLIGAWLVAPFTILEVIFIGLTLLHLLRRNQYQEIIRCTPEKLSITRTDSRQTQADNLPTYWAQVQFTPGAHSRYPSQLVIHSHGHYVSLGQCLNNEERCELAQALEKTLQQFRIVE